MAGRGGRHGEISWAWFGPDGTSELRPLVREAQEHATIRLASVRATASPSADDSLLERRRETRLGHQPSGRSPAELSAVRAQRTVGRPTTTAVIESRGGVSRIEEGCEHWPPCSDRPRRVTYASDISQFSASSTRAITRISLSACSKIVSSSGRPTSWLSALSSFRHSTRRCRRIRFVLAIRRGDSGSSVWSVTPWRYR